MNKSKVFMHNILKSFLPNSSKERNSEEDLQKIADQEQKVFAFDVLIAATNYFHQRNKLGEGGFGPVYKGKLVDGREIAVKKLSKTSSQGKKEFLNEAKLLASVQHRNVVNLLGYCVHGEEKLLVYEYVTNESLDKLLFKQGSRNTLDWNRRHDIIMGVAKGLLYLHDGSHTSIIHRDIKASNILLDDKWVPKIADFGMARLFSDEHTHVNTRAVGTNGYMAPEYVMHCLLSIKVDVFSFGVVILELICGQKNSSFSHDHECQSLLDWVYKLYRKGKTLDVIDPRLAPSSIPDDITTCIKIGLLCVQSDPQLRPTMQRVVVMLSRKPKTMEEPTRPGLPGSRYKRRSHKPVASSPGTETSSSASGTHSFGSTVVTTNTATTSISGLASPRSDPHGKRPVKPSISGLASPRNDPPGKCPVKATISGLTSTRSDPHGKRPVKETISGLTSTKSDPHGKRPMVYYTDS